MPMFFDGQQVNHYRIIKLLSEGGAGEVYQATDTINQQQVALKVFKPTSDPIISRPRREAHSFQHEHILSVSPVEHYNNVAYIVMPYLAGGSLKDRLLDKRIFTQEEVLQIATPLLQALSYLHSNMSIHRDIKPANILFDDRGQLKLCDFGIMKRLPTDISNPTQTHPRQAVGTPGYMAPEQMQGKAEIRSDLYSVGVILYEMLTGNRLFAGNFNEIIGKQLKGPQPLHKINREISPALEAVVLKALKSNPEQRYPSADALLQALTRAIKPLAATVQVSSPLTSTRRNIIIAAILVIGGGIISGIEFASGWRKPIPFHPAQPQPTILPTTPPSSIIKIATEMPTTGKDKANGLPIQNGVKMAIDEANNNNSVPGYTLKPLYKDDTGMNSKHDPSKGAENLKEIIKDDLVVGVVGPVNSNVAEQEIPMAAQAPIALISPSNTYPCLTQFNTNYCSYTPASLRKNNQMTYFRIATTDDVQGTAAAKYLYSLSYRNIYLISDLNSPYSQGLALAFGNAWQSKSGTNVIRINASEDATQDAYADAMKANFDNFIPDLVYYAGNTPGATNAQQAMTLLPELAHTAFAGGDGIVDAGFTTTIVPKLTSFSPPIYATIAAQGSLTSDFETNYKATFPEAPYTPYAASGYDCTKILIKAIQIVIRNNIPTPGDSEDVKGARKFRQAVINEIKKIQLTDGATGNHTFDSNGDTTNRTVSVYNLTYGDNDWRFITNISPGTPFS